MLIGVPDATNIIWLEHVDMLVHFNNLNRKINSCEWCGRIIPISTIRVFRVNALLFHVTISPPRHVLETSLISITISSAR